MLGLWAQSEMKDTEASENVLKGIISLDNLKKYVNCIFIVLKGSGWMLSLVQTIFPKLGILKLEAVFPRSSASTLKQEAVYSIRPIGKHWCSEARGLVLCCGP